MELFSKIKIAAAANLLTFGAGQDLAEYPERPVTIIVLSHPGW